jgi:hypothetical protein
MMRSLIKSSESAWEGRKIHCGRSAQSILSVALRSDSGTSPGRRFAGSTVLAQSTLIAGVTQTQRLFRHLRTTPYLTLLTDDFVQ